MKPAFAVSLAVLPCASLGVSAQTFTPARIPALSRLAAVALANALQTAAAPGSGLRALMSPAEKGG